MLYCMNVKDVTVLCGCLLGVSIIPQIQTPISCPPFHLNILYECEETWRVNLNKLLESLLISLQLNMSFQKIMRFHSFKIFKMFVGS